MKKDAPNEVTEYVPLTAPSGDDVAGGPVAAVAFTVSPGAPMTWDDFNLIGAFDADMQEQIAGDFARAAARHPDPAVVRDLNACAEGRKIFAATLRGPLTIGTGGPDREEKEWQEAEARIMNRAERDPILKAFIAESQAMCEAGWDDFIRKNPETWARKEEADRRAEVAIAAQRSPSQAPKSNGPSS